jgi:hypothetical protein
MLQLQSKPVSHFEFHLAQGLEAFNRSLFDEALALFRRAAGNDLRRAEPWYWMGRVQEEKNDRVAAGYCYGLAMSLGHNYLPARDAMRRLGYLDNPD